MADKSWQTIKVVFCEHAGREVQLDVEVVLPAEFLPETPPHVGAHRCSHALSCNLDGRSACVWAGTNPNFDPFGDIQ